MNNRIPLETIDTSNNFYLQIIAAENSGLERLDLSNNFEIIRLRLRGNRFSDINFLRGLQHLETVDVRDNLLTCEDLDAVNEIVDLVGEATEFFDWGVPIQGIAYRQQSGVNLAECDANINTESNFRDQNLRAGIEAFMGVEPGGEFTALEAANKTGVLDLSGREIRRVRDDLNFFPNVEEIDLSNNDLRTIAMLAESPILREDLRLDISNNMISRRESPNVIAIHRILGDNFIYMPQNREPGPDLDFYKVFNPENGHFYELISQPELDWEAARQYAGQLYDGSGYLATLTSREENDLIFSSYLGLKDVWLGGFQDPNIDETDGNYNAGWQWITDEPWQFTDWQNFEPNNEHETGQEDHLQIGHEFGWNDQNGGHISAFLVEWDAMPDPSFQSLLADNGFELGGAELSVNPGEVVHVPIDIAHVLPMTSFTLDLVYDPSYLTWQEEILYEDTLVSSWGLVGGNQVEEGRLRLSGAAFNGEPVNGDGTLAYIPMRVSEALDSDSFTINFENLKDGVENATPSPITFNVMQCVAGDVNGDGDISAADAQMAFEIALGLINATDAQRCAGEVNGDDEITAADAQAIFEVVLGINSFNEMLGFVPHQQDEAGSMTVETVPANPNDTVTVPVLIEAGNPIHSFTFELQYPTEMLAFTGIATENSLAGDFALFDANEFEPGMVRVAGAALTADPVAGDGVLVELNFTTRQNATGSGSIEVITLRDDIQNYAAGMGGVNITTGIVEWPLR